MQTNHDTFSKREEAVLQYLDELTDTAKQTISISRVATRLNYDYWESAAILSRLADAGILMQYDVLCCPEYQEGGWNREDWYRTMRTLRCTGRHE